MNPSILMTPIAFWDMWPLDDSPLASLGHPLAPSGLPWLPLGSFVLPQGLHPSISNGAGPLHN